MEMDGRSSNEYYEWFIDNGNFYAMKEEVCQMMVVDWLMIFAVESIKDGPKVHLISATNKEVV